ncbi:MAG: hypothetical protein ACI92Z_000161 [Paracoccaceae bacterium]|jgi:hypothetical protein
MSLFTTAAARPQPQQKLIQQFFEANKDHFSDLFQAGAFLRYLYTPNDGSWALRPNGKTGTTSTLYFLFHLMFGYPLSAQAVVDNSLNEDQAGHMLGRARVFSPLIARNDQSKPSRYLKQTLKLTTVRHPMARALSGFSYLCLSEELRHEMFFVDRVRMNALVGFDWKSHADTADGFVRFLTYLQHEIPHNDTRPLNGHFRPQLLNILPDVLQPDLVGRCEDLPAFFTEIADRLSRPLPDGAVTAQARNVAQVTDRSALITPEATRLVSEIFAGDFEAFGYDLL